MFLGLVVSILLHTFAPQILLMVQNIVYLPELQHDEKNSFPFDGLFGLSSHLLANALF